MNERTTNLNLSFVCGNRKFWKEIKPFFSDKGLVSVKITLDKGKD